MQFDQHISQQFNDELEQVKTQMLEMGGAVHKQLENAVQALESADSALAEQVLQAEVEIRRKRNGNRRSLYAVDCPPPARRQ